MSFKLCYKDEVLWQIILVETGNPFKFSVTGNPVLAVESSCAFSLLLPYFEKARDFTTGHKRQRKRVLYLFERYCEGYIFVPFNSYLEGGIKFFVGPLQILKKQTPRFKKLFKTPLKQGELLTVFSLCNRYFLMEMFYC